MELKDWVRAARAHKGLTLEKLGEALNRSKATAGFWESGATAPSYDQMRKISEVTGYPLPEAIRGEHPLADLNAARAQKWPFRYLDQAKIAALSDDDARELEGAWRDAAKRLNFNVEVSRSGKRKAA